MPVICSNNAHAGDTHEPVKSFHAGFASSTGLDIVGWKTEYPLNNHFYAFYSSGIASVFSAGFSFYGNEDASGLAITAGVALTIPSYAAVSYKWLVQKDTYFELGIGYATFLQGESAYPVISVEQRM